MVTRPNPIEKQPEQLLEVGPQVPKTDEHGNLVSSGPFRSRLHESHLTRAPKGEEWANGFLNKLPHWAMPMVTEFLESVPPDRVREAAKIFIELSEGITNSPEPKATIQHIIEAVRGRIAN